MKKGKVREFAKSPLGGIVILVGIASIFVPDPLPFVEEAIGIGLAYLRYTQ